MKILAICGTHLLMVVKNNRLKVTDKNIINEKCNVIDTLDETIAPEVCIGAWIKRIGPWEVPDKDYHENQIQEWLQKFKKL